MPLMHRAEGDEFVTIPGILMRIVAVRADGSPLGTPIWVSAQDGGVWYAPPPHLECLAGPRQDPGVARCIDGQPLPDRPGVIRGRMELGHDVGEDDRSRELYRHIARRYVPAECADADIHDTVGRFRADSLGRTVSGGQSRADSLGQTVPDGQPRALLRAMGADAGVRRRRIPGDEGSGNRVWPSRDYAEGSRMVSGES